MQTTEKPIVAFVLSLLGGLWMLAAGGMRCGFGWNGMMGSRQDMWMWGRGMHGYGLWWPWESVFAGVIVLIGAVMLYAKPEQHRTWGVVILVVSALNFFAGMGSLLAGALGVIGGVLAVSAKS